MPNPTIYGTVTPQTLISTSTTRQALPNVAARGVFVQNIDASNAIYLGDSTVTYQGAGKVFCYLPAGAGFFFEMSNTSLLGYAVAAASTPKLAVTVFK